MKKVILLMALFTSSLQAATLCNLKNELDYFGQSFLILEMPSLYASLLENSEAVLLIQDLRHTRSL